MRVRNQHPIRDLSTSFRRNCFDGNHAFFRVPLSHYINGCLFLSVSGTIGDYSICVVCIDSRPNWDDTGVTAGAILLTCGILALLSPSRWWVWVFAVGSWIPLFGIVQTHNYGAVLALVVAFLGVLSGVGIRHLLSHKAVPHS